MKKQQRSDNLASSLTECIDQIAATHGLLPCPHCGRSGDISIITPEELYPECEKCGSTMVLDNAGYFIVCDAKGGRPGCGASCGWQPTIEHAIAAWNRRTTDKLSGQALKTTEKPNEHP